MTTPKIMPDGSIRYPEDRYHIKLPNGEWYNTVEYTGAHREGKKLTTKADWDTTCKHPKVYFDTFAAAREVCRQLIAQARSLGAADYMPEIWQSEVAIVHEVPVYRGTL
jgi:hypothetical protein